MINHLGALCLGFLLDLLIGDPRFLYHPVRFIGLLITKLEKFLRNAFPRTPKGEFWAGFVLCVITLIIPTAITYGIIYVAENVNIYLSFAIETLICYQLLATKSLKDESMKVYLQLKKGNLEKARHAVSMIVGRDTKSLDEAGVAKAAVETVAENFSDGVLAPMIFMAIGGAPLGMFYKAANTLDSMVGYKNDKYMYFGRVSAIFDDILNFFPARLGGLIMSVSARFAKLDSKKAMKIFLRDRKNHKSPNSAHTEAAAAGALHIQLAGDNFYFGKLVKKPTIGDDDRAISYIDIAKVNKLMYASAFTSIILLVIITLIGWWLI